MNLTCRIREAGREIGRFLAISAPVCAIAFTAGAVPAKPGAMRYDNGGKTVEVFLHGDENSHYFTGKDGVMLLRGDDGRFRYALPDGTRLRASSMTASDPASRSDDEVSLLASFDRKAPFRILEASAAKSAKRKAVSRNMAKVADESYLNTFPTKGSPRCLAILVQFQDVKFTLENPNALFKDMLNEEGFNRHRATGSAADYFKASSNGQFVPQFDVYGPVTLPYNMSYYGGNDMTGNDARPYEMVPHAVDLLRDQIDFSIYDTDNDGVVDNIYFFYAGYGEADGGPANSIWPHSWNIHDDLGMEIYMNGKLINHYATSNELVWGKSNELAGIGVFCHEFSHVLGLPDLYSTTYTGAFTPGEWSLMDHGSYNNDSHTPPCHTGYERYCLGWVEPFRLKDPLNVTMYPISQEGAYSDVYMIPTEKKTEYFILENRQQRGWDEYIPGHGLLVWHIDFVPDMWDLNIVNIEKQYIDIVEADDTRSEGTRSGDTFPGTAGVREFTDDSKPAMRSWSGQRLHAPITGIMENNGVITFAFKGGENIFGEIKALEAADIRTAAFTARWQKVDKANGYLLSVYRKKQTSGSSEVEYIDGFNQREVGDVTSFVVENLDPETTYYYSVMATNGRFYSPESNEMEVTTLLPTLDYKSVTALSPTAVSESSFTANWKPLEEAESYEICLYALRLGKAFIAETDFAGKLLPEGWTSDNASFDGRESYAATVPSLRFTADGSALTSPRLNGIRSISFWYRAGSVDDESALVVDVFADGEWKNVAKIAPLVTDRGGKEVNIEAGIPTTANRVRISFRRSAGSVSIDDVKIGYGGNLAYSPVEGMDAVDAGNNTSYTFSGLTPGLDYGYSVIAVGGGLRSKPSSIVSVGKGSAVEEFDASSSALRIEGRRIIVEGASSAQVVVCDAAGISLASGDGESFSFTVPAPGIYIVRIGGKAFKTAIR